MTSLPTTTATFLTTPATCVPMAMFCVLVSIMPDPATKVSKGARGGSITGGEAGGGLLPLTTVMTPKMTPAMASSGMRNVLIMIRLRSWRPGG
ncbi:MAG: hypothetical protein L6Q35_07580 [Phycisphaerales bacterium]|nr:hypothetical protein [Phycisphaerales bacterium]